MPTISDKDFSLDWVHKAQAGEESAQKAIYLHFAPQVYRLARHMLQCETTAEEVLQDCFVDIICKIESFKHQGSFAGWVRQIAVNHCLMIMRSAWFKKRSEMNELEFNISGDHEHFDHQAAKQMNEALSNLPAPTRAVLWLHDVEGYTHGEIGKMMGKTKSYSKSQLSRAHEKLRALLSRSVINPIINDQQAGPKKNLTSDTSPVLGEDTCTPVLNSY